MTCPGFEGKARKQRAFIGNQRLSKVQLCSTPNADRRAAASAELQKTGEEKVEGNNNNNSMKEKRRERMVEIGQSRTDLKSGDGCPTSQRPSWRLQRALWHHRTKRGCSMVTWLTAGFLEELRG